MSDNKIKLQKALDFIEQWTNNWQLKIQAAKSEQITFYPNKKLKSSTDGCSFDINGSTYSKTKFIKDLGLHLFSDLKWAEYISKTQIKSNSLAYIIFRTFKSKEPNLYITLYKTYIQPFFEYNCSIWSPYLLKDIEHAEYKQKSFTRKICKKLNIKYKSYDDRLTILNLEILELRILRFNIILD